ncbi:MAG: hypothetical protein G01um101418_901 [Parcubacteria group bacterium Gr01-1014_18]|nr:MAG: hypothetical protein Greene041636_940 [Parcubacteria group bacterium Greene0416_36]TSC79797.1 MAG: hypothetical protein G01um101418_901 [Parcubacteria group bacterium Gr01-1014_18]TSC98081.1 MAG: hypothetical protein Greene101420_910 [Parcubacteria group bacterium Greene1014_20]TSD06516.1 MAG: hypothetical protein Greene07142_859 [Parcubacteria group bacterium Greene0714_2]
MRTSTLFTVSMPSVLANKTNKLAKAKQMTRSELIRYAVRNLLEEADLEGSIDIAHRELKNGTIKTLGKGGLASLMRQ